MKLKSSIKALKKRSSDCQVVRRKGKVFIISKDKRFKARQKGSA